MVCELQSSIFYFKRQTKVCGAVRVSLWNGMCLLVSAVKLAVSMKKHFNCNNVVLKTIVERELKKNQINKYSIDRQSFEMIYFKIKSNLNP